jgi:hypothetical protein
LIPFGLLVWRFDFLYDDAYISFRYASNFANGHGLRFNLGVEPPVEGYTNFLWVLVLAVVEWFGAAPTLWSRVFSFSSALVLFWAVLRRSDRGAERPLIEIAGTALFFATLPPLAVWATSGLETMAFTLALFLTYDRLAGRGKKGNWLQAGFAGALAALLRADGAVYVGIVLSAVVATAVRGQHRAALRACIRTGTLTALAVIGHVAWRYSYYRDLLPNTAHTKVSFSIYSLRQGRDYLMELMLTFPSIPLVLLAALAFLLWKRSREDSALLLIAYGVLSVVVVVGGDFMTMGRFVVPALPFICVLFGRQLAYLRDLARGSEFFAVAWLVAMVSLSLPGAFDLHVVPESVRARYRLARFNADNTTQYKLWQIQKRNTNTRVTLGKALMRYTQPGETIVEGAIGAVGYYSQMFIYDKFGLVNREVSRREMPTERMHSRGRPPGHLKDVSPEFFVKFRPTYLHAALVAERKPRTDRDPFPGGRLGTSRYSIQNECHDLEEDLSSDGIRFLCLERLVFNDRSERKRNAGSKVRE